MIFQKPKGTVDIISDISKWQQIEAILKMTAQIYNYNEIRIPFFEQSELFLRSIGGETDILEKEIYQFNDKKGRNLSLRPEGTSGIIRAYIEHKLYAQKIIKVFYLGPMFRYERPQKGRQRQFYQFGIEAIGLASPHLDAEIIAMAISILHILGIKKINLKINSLGDKTALIKYKSALKNYFKDKLITLCKDCNKRYWNNILRLLDCKIDQINFKKVPKLIDYLGKNSIKQFNQLKKILTNLKIKYIEDYSLVRGLDYYNETIFEIEPINAKGSQSAILGGGRYENIIKELGGPQVPGCGFAIGMERLLNLTNDAIFQTDLSLDVFIIVEDKKCYFAAVNILTTLRAIGIKSDFDYSFSDVKKQFKYLKNHQSKYALILNQENISKKQVIIKNQVTKNKKIIKINDLANYFSKEIT